MSHARTYTATLLVFLVVDAFWLGFIGGPLYTSMIGPILAEQFRIAPAIIFYLVHTAGIVLLVLPLARARGTLWAAAGYGALFGLCTYGTFDLTNHAVLRIWAWQLTVIDMIWGACLTAISATAGAWVERRGSR
ncbi:MAG: DUF2177 family protein [Alphaproteobacteria bacterium]|nr:DUF2177 family protein [Alphaproteobacteria bacterium]